MDSVIVLSTSSLQYKIIVSNFLFFIIFHYTLINFLIT